MYAWVAFGLLGALLGTVWAAGFATSNSTIDTVNSNDADPVFATSPDAAPAGELADNVTSEGALSIAFNGQWGRLDAHTPIFNVDLTDQETTESFFTQVNLGNNPTGWSALQVEFRLVSKACADITDPATDWTGATNTSVMVVDNADAYAVFSGLAGGASYCIGVAQALPRADDINGTYLRRPSGTVEPVAPSFLALLNRTA